MLYIYIDNASFLYKILSLEAVYTSLPPSFSICFLKIVAFSFITNQVSNKHASMLIRFTFTHCVFLSSCCQKNKSIISGPTNCIWLCKEFLIIFTKFAYSCIFTFSQQYIISDKRTTNFLIITSTVKFQIQVSIDD